MTHQDRLRAHRNAARQAIEKWIVVWTAMRPEETLRTFGCTGGMVAHDARRLLDTMEEAERNVETERLNAIPVLPDDRGVLMARPERVGTSSAASRDRRGSAHARRSGATRASRRTEPRPGSHPTSTARGRRPPTGATTMRSMVARMIPRRMSSGSRSQSSILRSAERAPSVRSWRSASRSASSSARSARRCDAWRRPGPRRPGTLRARLRGRPSRRARPGAAARRGPATRGLELRISSRLAFSSPIDELLDAARRRSWRAHVQSGRRVVLAAVERIAAIVRRGHPGAARRAHEHALAGEQAIGLRSGAAGGATVLYPMPKVRRR